MLHINYSTFQLCFLCAYFLQISTGCAQGDDPETVALINKHVSPRGIHTISDENGVNRIYHLSLPNNSKGLEILPHLDKLEHLKVLYIAYDGLTDEDLNLLPSLPHLRELRIGKNHVTDEGLKCLAGMKELRELSLHKTQIRGPGLIHLKDSSQLEKLDLSNTSINDDAVPHIVQNFKKLKELDFSHTNITQDGWMQLTELHWLTKMVPPNDIFGFAHDRKVQREKKKEFLRKYNQAYLDSLQKARDAGEDVPSRTIKPFGGVE